MNIKETGDHIAKWIQNEITTKENMTLHRVERTIPAEKPTAWTAKDSEREMLRLNNELIESQAQAAQLAEALRDALKYADSATEHPENKAAFKRIITKALAAYEAAR